jgi:hypothetical protein
MQLVEQHVISTSDPRFQSIDEMAFASKNLWNLANYTACRLNEALVISCHEFPVL